MSTKNLSPEAELCNICRENPIGPKSRTKCCYVCYQKKYRKGEIISGTKYSGVRCACGTKPQRGGTVCSRCRKRQQSLNIQKQKALVKKQIEQTEEPRVCIKCSSCEGVTKDKPLCNYCRNMNTHRSLSPPISRRCECGNVTRLSKMKCSACIAKEVQKESIRQRMRK